MSFFWALPYKLLHFVGQVRMHHTKFISLILPLPESRDNITKVPNKT